MPDTPSFSLTMEPDDTIVAAIVKRVPRNFFDDFRSATQRAGLKWHKQSGTNRGYFPEGMRPGVVLDFVEAMASRGHKVYVDENVLALLPSSQEEDEDSSEESFEIPQEFLDAIDDLQERGITPYPHQLKGIAWLSQRKGALFHDDMGLGKTLQSLVAAEVRGSVDAPVFVVCPSSVKGNWAAEVERFTSFVPTVLEGRGSFVPPEPGEVIITGWATLPDPDEVKAMSFAEDTIAIFDEAQYAKSSKAKRTLSAWALAQAARNSGSLGASWGLTGTPILNKPSDLWTILGWLGLRGETYGRGSDGFYEFLSYWGGYKGRYGIEWGSPRPDAAAPLEGHALGRRKGEVLKDLPEKRYADKLLDVSKKILPALKKIVASLTKKGFTLGEDNEGRAVLINASGDAVTLEEVVSNKPAFEELSRARSILAGAKGDAFCEILEDYVGTPLVVFTSYLSVVERMQECAKKFGIKYAVIDGSVTGADRTAAVKAFQDGKVDLIIGTKAMAEGVTLTRASDMVFVDLFWSPAVNQQAQDRIHRIGQKSSPLYVTLTADHPLDEAMQAILGQKQERLDAIDEIAVDLDSLAAAFAPPPAAGGGRSEIDPAAWVALLPGDEDEGDEDEDEGDEEEDEDTWQTILDYVKERKAESGLKHLKIRLFADVEDENAQTLVLALAESGRNAGGINLTNGAAFRSPSNIFFGKITRDGELDNRALEEGHLAALRAFAEDPETALALYGQETGQCGVCGRELTDPGSVAAGIGPICAERMGF